MLASDRIERGWIGAYGQTVKIDAGGGVGWRNSDMSADEWLKHYNVPATTSDPAVKESIEVWEKTERYADIQSGHFIVGPIAIEGAMPGDSIEIRVWSVKSRIPYGTTGVMPGRSLKRDENAPRRPAHVTVLDLERKVGLFSQGVEVPLYPFMGVMGLQPPDSEGPNRASGPPGNFGGNIDCRELIDGSTLYLPVFHPGGRFFTGDSHAAQGDGEVAGTAIENANTLTATFILHKGKTLAMPRAETPTHYIAFGMDPDLENAMQQAFDETINLINEVNGWQGSELAIPLMSMGVDFHITQIVDRTKGIHSMIPKSFFKNVKQDYWYATN